MAQPHPIHKHIKRHLNIKPQAVTTLKYFLILAAFILLVVVLIIVVKGLGLGP